MLAILALALIVLPIAEIYLLIQVGQAIGAAWTVALLVGVCLAGAWLVKREGRRTWTALQEAAQGAALTGRLPDREVLDAALVLVGGTLLLAPGFLTDLIGLCCILPFFRPVTRSLVSAVIRRRFANRFPVEAWPGATGHGPHGGGGQVIQGEVIEPDDERR